MPFTAAPEIVLSTALAASLMVSTGLLRAMGVVLKRRAWRAICWRNMVMMCGVCVVDEVVLGVLGAVRAQRWFNW